MSNRTKFFYGVLASLLLIAVVANRTAPQRSRLPARRVIPLIPPTGKNATITMTPGARSPDGKPAPVTMPEQSRALTRWFISEAQHIEDRDVDTLATEKELKARAARLTNADIDFLAGRAMSPVAPASERILANYLLGLAADHATNALIQIANRPLDNPGPAAPHSIDEAKNVQERAFKIMAVDAIFHSNSETSQKVAQLQSIINQTPDSTVKKYATGKLGELTGTL